MTNRIFVLIIISVLLLIIDFYIFKAYFCKTKWTHKNENTSNGFAGDIHLLIIGVFAGIYFNLRLSRPGQLYW